MYQVLLSNDNNIHIPRMLAWRQGFRYHCSRCGRLYKTRKGIEHHVTNDDKCGAKFKSFPENRIEEI